MKVNKFTILFLFFISLNLKAQDNSSPIFLNADQLSITVLDLRKQVNSDTINGTASFITKNNKLYIVTATHVAKHMDASAYVMLQGPDNKSIKLNLIQLAYPVIWINHKEADLSILELSPIKGIYEKYLQGRFIPFEMIDTTHSSIPRNTQLTIIGFPLGLGSIGYFSPLTYRTFPSSSLLTLNRADTQTPQAFIILENPSVGGYSGGPVYDLSIIESGQMIMTGNGTKLLGFIHGTLSDNTGGKLTAMTPAFYISDLLK